MAEQKLVGQNYTVPDLVAKVTGRSKYAEDFRAEGMLFTWGGGSVWGDVVPPGEPGSMVVPPTRTRAG